jgi:hypothetical protein
MGKRKRSKEAEAILDTVRQQRCLVCSAPPPSDSCHIQTRGSSGPDSFDNLMALCRRHHSEQHQIGIRTFVNKYALPISWESGWPRRTDVK